ncbi:hypothetical protein F2P56_017283, partial [Juglans regia]
MAITTCAVIPPKSRELAGPDVPRYVLLTVGYSLFCSLFVIVLVHADIWTGSIFAYTRFDDVQLILGKLGMFCLSLQFSGVSIEAFIAKMEEFLSFGAGHTGVHSCLL